MAQYTIEDIEIVRQKSGISYEEAVNLLEYHNGSLARALVDLEKNGKLKDAKRSKDAGHTRGESIFSFLYRFRVKVKKDNITIINLSLLFCLFTIIVAFWVPVVGLIAALVLGYRISLERNSRDFSSDSFENIVKKASSNVKNSVESIARDIENAVDQHKDSQKAPEKDEGTRTETAASGTTPVNVQFPDGGSVEVKEDADGFHEADIQ